MNKFLRYSTAGIMAILLASCSSDMDAEMATQVADGTIPPWLADSDTDDTGHYSEVSKTAPYQASSSSSTSKSSAKKPSSSSKSTASRTSSKKSSSSSKKPTYTVYTVKKGDAVEKIARRYGTSVTSIKNANGMKSDLIRIGQKLRIPRK